MKKVRKIRKIRKPKSAGFFQSLSNRVRNWYLRRKFREPIRPTPTTSYALPEEKQGYCPVNLNLNLSGKWNTLQKKRSKDKLESPSKMFKLSRRLSYQLVFTCCILIVLGALSFAFLHFQHKSQKLEYSLKTAIKESDWKTVHILLPQCDIHVYHFLNKRLIYTVGDAESWVERQRTLYSKLKQRIEKLESGTVRIENLSIHAVSDIERSLKILPSAINDLNNRWAILLSANRELLTKSRNFIINKIISAPDIQSLLSNDIEADKKILQKHISEWSDLIETCGTYGIPDNLALRGRYYLEELLQFKEELEAYQGFTKAIESIVTYSELSKWLNNRKAKKYVPTMRLYSFLEALPTYESWQTKMLPINKLFPEAAREAAFTQLIKAGVSYSSYFPATPEQYALMDELFSAPSFHQTFYQIISPDGKAFICTHYTVKHEKTTKQLVLQRSELDPAFSLNGHNMVALEAERMQVRKISLSGFLNECGINREHFFTQTHLLQLLDKIADFNDSTCPVLAKAYVYDRILRLVESHPIWGKYRDEFAPRLAADTKSFAQLRKKHEPLLYCGAWFLSPTKTKTAEQDFSAWFKKHRERNYVGEPTLLAAPWFRAKPHYVGFVDASGQMKLRAKVPENQFIWYLSSTGIKDIPVNQQPTDALPFSPLFIDILHR